MPKVRVKVEGLSELKRKLDKLADIDRTSALKDAALAGAEPIRSAVERYAPRASSPSHPELGHLADHIITEEPRKTAKGATTRVGPAAGYFWGLFLEFGTSKIQARPFMRPAFDNERDNAIEEQKDSLAGSIVKVARGS